MVEKDFKYLVRIANTDLDGNKPLNHALRKIKGINFMLANAICIIAGIDKFQKAGSLSDNDIKKIDNIVKNLSKQSIPSWLFNRKNDSETGKDMHLIGADLDFRKQNDVQMMKKIKSYKGVRHMFGLPARGQRTRSNFRKKKGKVMGVQKKKGIRSGRP